MRDIDFNPNKIYHFATCGDDCQVNFWDSRKTKQPLMIRRDHSHWYGRAWWSCRSCDYTVEYIMYVQFIYMVTYTLSVLRTDAPHYSPQISQLFHVFLLVVYVTVA